MKRVFYSTLFMCFCAVNALSAQPMNLLQKIRTILSEKKATVGVSIIGNGGKDVIGINDTQRFPMQSAFKFHIALVMLSEIDKGKFSLDQPIEITKAEMQPDTYSPIRDEHPEGATLPLFEIIKQTVSASDNVGCDKLIKLLGGTENIQRYFNAKRFRGFAIRYNEQVMQSQWDFQFENWTTPKAANELLAAFFYNKRKRLLSQNSHDFLWKTMRETSTGAMRLKGQLPENTVVAHKTGTSGRRDGIRAAVNDMGIVFLPNGKHFFISVFVSNSKENDETNEKIIADIAKAAYDYFNAE